MILLVVALVIVVAAFRTPWRALTPLERVWAALALGDAVATFSIPTVPATSHWRPLQERALWSCAVGCVVLIIAGIPLVRARVSAGRPWQQLMPPFGVLAVPAFAMALTSLLWGVARG